MESRKSPHIASQPEIQVTRWDLGRLDHLLSQHAMKWSWKAVEFLVRELMRANIVDELDVSPAVVTMRSRVMFRQDNGEIEQIATLAYPGEREYFDDAVSVLTPVGAALIGLSEGQSISYPAPDGDWKVLTVLKVLSQPEHTRRTDKKEPNQKLTSAQKLRPLA